MADNVAWPPPVSDPNPVATSPRRRRAVLPWLVLLALLAFAGWRGWAWWHGQALRVAVEEADSRQRLAALEARADGLRRDQRVQAERIQQAEATNRVLRDELLGIGQRAALLEDSVSRLADPERHGVQALRLDEVELLLSQAQQRLLLASDLDGAKRLEALAAGILDGIDDPAYLDLRQTLAQERAALDAAGPDPRTLLARRLADFADALEAQPRERVPGTNASGGTSAWLRRVLDRIVAVRPSRQQAIVDPADLRAGRLALQVELSLARAALERRDAAAWRAALDRIDAWMTRLWPDSPGLQRLRQQLRGLRDATLTPSLPLIGSSLDQLRTLRAGH